MNTDFESYPPRTDLTNKLAEKEYRDAFVEGRIRRGLPLQIRAMRGSRSQQEIGELLGIPQANVSRIENTRDTFLSFPTLLKIAAAFDVALIVKFAPFSELERWALTPVEEMVPANYEADKPLHQATINSLITERDHEDVVYVPASSETAEPNIRADVTSNAMTWIRVKSLKTSLLPYAFGPTSHAIKTANNPGELQ